MWVQRGGAYAVDSVDNVAMTFEHLSLDDVLNVRLTCPEKLSQLSESPDVASRKYRDSSERHVVNAQLLGSTGVCALWRAAPSEVAVATACV